MTLNPDAYDEHGDPMYKSDLLTVCPAGHVERGREIALTFFRDVMQAKGATLEVMFTKCVAPVGETTPTHYVCPRRVYPYEQQRQLETQADLPDAFVAEGLVDINAADALTTFCCIACDLPAFLAAHGMAVLP